MPLPPESATLTILVDETVQNLELALQSDSRLQELSAQFPGQGLFQIGGTDDRVEIFSIINDVVLNELINFLDKVDMPYVVEEA